MKPTFEQWMSLVNKELIKTIGLDSECLVDCDYHSMYTAGFDPAEAAKDVLSQQDLLDDEDLDELWDRR